jgi:hypothetical protein
MLMFVRMPMPTILPSTLVCLLHSFLVAQVEEFMLWPVQRVAEVVAGGTEFKTNCNLVIIDFLLRHGLLSPDQPGYLQLVRGVRQGDCT